MGREQFINDFNVVETEVMPLIDGLPLSMKSSGDSVAEPLSLDEYFTSKNPLDKLGRVITAVGKTLESARNVRWTEASQEQRKDILLVTVKEALGELSQFETEFQRLSLPDDQTYKDKKRRLLADLYIGCGNIPLPYDKYDRWHYAYIDKRDAFTVTELRNFYKALGVDSQHPIWYNKEALQKKILELADVYRDHPQRNARNAFPVDYPTRLTGYFELVVNYYYCRMWGSPLGINVDIMARPLGDLKDGLGYEEIDVARIGLGQPINPRKALPQLFQEAAQG